MMEWRHKSAFALLIVLCLLHGVFASGFVPIIHQYAPEHAALAFGLYFWGILLGQFLIYKIPSLSEGGLKFPLYETLFGVSLVSMGMGFAFLPYNLIFGRFFEGVAGGLGIPLMFAYVVKLRAFRSTGVQITLFQSVFALGFVAGPPAISALLESESTAVVLALFGATFVAIAAAFKLILRGAGEREAAPHAEAHSSGGWFDTFYTLFLAKSYYGFLLPFATAHLASRFLPLSIAQVMLIFSGVFIVGQVVANPVSKFFPREWLQINLPMLLIVGLAAYLYTGSPWPFLAASALQAMILFVGLLNVAGKPSGAREFAFYNCLSDPGMLAGAAVAGLGERGVYVMIALFAVPFVRYLFRDSGLVRAERLLPFVGPLTIAKLLRKQRNPHRGAEDLGADRAKVAERLAFTHETAPGGSGAARFKFVFAGDFAPTPDVVELEPMLRAFVLRHDVRALNLEGPRTADVYDGLNKLICFDVPAAQFSRVSSVFNVISVANNHVLDRGLSKFDETLAGLRAGSNLVAVDAGLSALEVKGVKIGFLARTFGTNMFWRRHPGVAVVKPEDVVRGTPVGKRLLAEIREHKSRVDILVLSFHWGYEAEFWPSRMQLDCWKLLRAAGVDILFGHHSHIVQPFEVALDDHALCLYSCGNFVSNMPLTIYNEGALFSVTVAKGDAGFRIERVETHFTRRERGLVRLIGTKDSEVYGFWSALR